MPRVAAKAQKKKPVCDTKPALEEGVSFDDVHTWYIVTELRAFLREQGLPVSGRKAELVQRVIDHLDSDSDSGSPKEDDSENEEDEEGDERGKEEQKKKARIKQPANAKRSSKKQQESEDEASDTDGTVEASGDDDEEDEESDGEESEEEEEEADQESSEEEYDFEPYKVNPGFQKLLMRIGGVCESVADPLPMRLIDQFEQQLRTNLGKHVRLPNDLRQLYRFCNGLQNEEDNFTVCPLVDVGDGRGGPMTHADIFGPGHCGWLDMAEDPAWIPFATGSMEEEHEIFMVNANLDSESYGHVMLLIRDCFDDGERVEARSIYSMMSKRWRNVC